MTEKFEPQEYRDELADKLTEIRNSDPENQEIADAKAQGFLMASKETKEYKNAEKNAHNYLPAQKKLEKEKTLSKEKMDLILLDLNSKISQLAQDPKIGYLFKDIILIETDIESMRPYLSYWSPTISDISYEGQEYSVRFIWSSKPTKLSEKDLDFLLENQNLIPDFLRDIKIPVWTGNDGQAYGTSYLLVEYDKEKQTWYKNDPSSYVNRATSGISSIRFKEKIQPLKNNIDKLGKIRGVSFKWKSRGDSPREIGVIAEEVAEVFPELVFLDNKGKPLGVHYDKFVAVLIEAVKELNKKIEKLENKI